MRAIVAVLALAAVAYGFPATSEETNQNVMMTLADDGKTLIVENLDDPVVITYGVDINKLKFMLYTRLNRDSPQELKNNDVNLLKSSYYAPNRPTKFLIHGWQNSYQAEAVQIIKDAYLQHGDVNVIVFDYEKYNAPYLSAVGNAQTIGENVGVFINFLISQGLSVNDLHITGHSLGAHIAGFSANAVKGAVPRVTGLDPAGPLFGLNKPENRLSNDDATIVDIIHTSKSLGMGKAIGTSDFYPNGGSKQPACSSSLISDGCDHASSYRYFAQTIGNRLQFPARACQNEDDAKVADANKNKCTASSVVMGEDANIGSAGIFYVAIA